MPAVRRGDLWPDFQVRERAHAQKFRHKERDRQASGPNIQRDALLLLIYLLMDKVYIIVFMKNKISDHVAL